MSRPPKLPPAAPLRGLALALLGDRDDPWATFCGLPLAAQREVCGLLRDMPPGPRRLRASERAEFVTTWRARREDA